MVDSEKKWLTPGCPKTGESCCFYGYPSGFTAKSSIVAILLKINIFPLRLSVLLILRTTVKLMRYI